jgi:hypothetical protein
MFVFDSNSAIYTRALATATGSVLSVDLEAVNISSLARWCSRI